MSTDRTRFPALLSELHSRACGTCPLWVISGHLRLRYGCPLLRAKRTFSCNIMRLSQVKPKASGSSRYPSVPSSPTSPHSPHPAANGVGRLMTTILALCCRASRRMVSERMARDRRYLFLSSSLTIGRPLFLGALSLGCQHIYFRAICRPTFGVHDL